jgi:Ca-activated chloride channel family protein
LGTLEYPAALALLLLLPPVIWLVHFSPFRGGRVAFAWRIWNGQGFAPGAQPARLLLFLSEAAFWLGCALLIVALAGPQRVSRQKSYLSRGLDIMVVLDESPSMLAQDFKPDHRFDAARSVIRDFIHGRENDPIGLVTFAEQAALRVPPTVDYPLVLQALDALAVGSLRDGTAIGMGLALASLHLSRSTAQGRVIILLTDGENNAGEVAPDDAAGAAARLGIRVHTVGIGREGEAPLVYTDPETGRTVRGTYRGRFDEALLRRIARASGGRYFHASSPGVLGAIFEAIDSYEKTEKRVRITVTRVPLQDRFALAGLLLVLLRVLAGKVLLREVF